MFTLRYAMNTGTTRNTSKNDQLEVSLKKKPSMKLLAFDLAVYQCFTWAVYHFMETAH